VIGVVALWVVSEMPVAVAGFFVAVMAAVTVLTLRWHRRTTGS
jgi:hypothetical protein